MVGYLCATFCFLSDCKNYGNTIADFFIEFMGALDEQPSNLKTTTKRCFWCSRLRKCGEFWSRIWVNMLQDYHSQGCGSAYIFIPGSGSNHRKQNIRIGFHLNANHIWVKCSLFVLGGRGTLSHGSVLPHWLVKEISWI